MSARDLDGADSWIDVTVPIHDGMVSWPGDPGVRVQRVRDQERGDEVTVTRLDLGAHTGTHVDAPVHFVRGAAAIDEMALDGFIGAARVAALPGVAAITRPMVDSLDLGAGERILFRTDNSERCWKTDRFSPDYVYLALDGAQRLVELGVRTVGIDYLSIGGGGDTVAIHQALLNAGICIIEGLDLGAVQPGRYDLVCLPLRVRAGDGAPARALLRPRS